jgi:hypothetical protein
LQNGTTVVFIVLAGLLGLAKVEYLTLDFAKKWCPVSIAFVVMIWTSMEALKLVGVPAMTALRNATTLFVVFSDYFILKSRISHQCMFWLGFMFLSMIWFCLGAAAAESKNASSLASEFIQSKNVSCSTSNITESKNVSSSASDFAKGLLFLLANVLATFVNHIYAKSVMNKTAIDGFTIALYNNALSLIALVPLAAYYEILVPINPCSSSSSTSVISWGHFLIALSSILASVLAVSSYLVQKRVQVTSFSVASNSSKILAIIINQWWPAKSEIWNVNKLCGLVSTLFCAFMYTRENNHQTRTSEASQTLARHIFPAFFICICALCLNSSLSFLL